MISIQVSVSVQLLRESNSLWPHEPQHTRPPCPSPTPRVHPNPCALSWWCHPTISSSVVPFSSCPQSFPASGSSQMSQLFPSGGQSIGILVWVNILGSLTIEDTHGVRSFHQFSSIAQSGRTPCIPMGCGKPGLPVHHQCLEPTQTHIQCIGDAIQPSQPLLPLLFFVFSLFQWVSCLHQVAKVLELQIQHQSFQWIFSIDFL